MYGIVVIGAKDTHISTTSFSKVNLYFVDYYHFYFIKYYCQSTYRSQFFRDLLSHSIVSKSVYRRK